MSHFLVNDRPRVSQWPPDAFQHPEPSSAPALGTTDRDNSTASTSRRTNKACKNCARIKCKCIPRSDGSATCERCHRLSKTCEPSVTIPSTTRTRRARLPNRPDGKTTSRSARLEAKLNDLVDLLRTSKTIGTSLEGSVQGDTNADSNKEDNADRDIGRDVAANGDDDDDDDDNDDGNDGDASGDEDGGVIHVSIPPETNATTAVNDSTPQSSHTGTSTAAGSATVVDDYAEDLLPHEAEACLRRFRDEMAPLAPFVYIPPEMTASLVRQQYPFLWCCIKASACFHINHRVRAASQARRVIIHDVIDQGERSLDHLLGMLTYLTWAHLSAKDRRHRNFSTLVAQVSVCVAWDLGLPLPPLLEQSAAAERFVPVVPIPGIPASMWKANRSMEERRSVLGVYLVTSVMSHMFRSADGLRWSPYLDQCLGHVAQHSTVPQDAILVRLVKMQLLINHVRYTASINSMSSISAASCGSVNRPTGGNGPAGIMSAPYIDALRAQLDEIAGVVDSDSPAFDNFSVHNLYHFAVLAIHESFLAQAPKFHPTSPGVDTRQQQQQQHHQNNMYHQYQLYHPHQSAWMLPDMSRLGVYQRCLVSVKAWFDRFLSWPWQFYNCLPCGAYFQLFYILVCLQKLSTIQDPAWNLEAVRSVIDLYPTIDRIIAMCEELREKLANQSGGDPAKGEAKGENDMDEFDPFLLTIRKFKTLKSIWLKEAAAREREREREQEPERQPGGERDLGGHELPTNSLFSTGVGSGASAAGARIDLGMGSATTPFLPADPIDSTANVAPDNIALNSSSLSPGYLFSSYSLDVLNYFNAEPDLMSDLPWA